MAPAAAATAPASSTIAGPQGGAVMLFGRRVSWDSIIVAGATLLGILFMYLLSRPGTSTGVALGTPVAAGSDTTSTTTAGNPTVPIDTSSAVVTSSSAGQPGAQSITTLGVPPPQSNGTPSTPVHSDPSPAAAPSGSIVAHVGAAAPGFKDPPVTSTPKASVASSIVARLGATAPGFREPAPPPPPPLPTTVTPRDPVAGRRGGTQIV